MDLLGFLVSFVHGGSPNAPLAAQQPALGSVGGIVYDSLTRRPLAGALVQIVEATEGVRARTFAATSDSLGSYRITGLPRGDYLAGFFHPVLDSLGFASTHERVTLTTDTRRLDFAIPAAPTIMAAICPESARSDSSGGVLIGHVRRSQEMDPLAGAVVTASWTGLVAGPLLIKPQEWTLVAESTQQGWFALCGLPGETPILLRAAHGTDSSGYVRLILPARGLRHEVFYVGGAAPQAPPAGDSAAGGTDRDRAATITVWRGPYRLRGVVRDDRQRPLAGAEVHVWGMGISVRANARGEFVLDSVPGGTQTVEARAVGFVPAQTAVDMTGDRPTTVEMRLDTKAVALPTVNVRAAANAGIRMTRFYERMRDAEKGINHGYFITPEDLDRRRPPLVSHLVEGITGISVVRSPTDPIRGVSIKGPLRIGPMTWCEMTIYVDGIRFWPKLNTDHVPWAERSIDLLLNTATIAAMEVYPRPVSAPPEYQSLNGTCGVILIWTK